MGGSTDFPQKCAVYLSITINDIDYVEILCTAVGPVCITWGIVVAGNHVGEAKGITAHTWLFLVLSGAATGLSWLFYFKALQTGDVARVAPIDKLSVVITIGLALIFLKETVSARVIVGALFITAGSIMMLYK